ncbi:hypothetical protein QFC22_006308 [Naganishia vaughanmartiniae]|uniref:Uncharacterized protein n=1 Tax=Naganishia vaughanmartiniae TaxID=1424756 RepID=A0ACC2WKF6_9TREE|nr:hypothetical protein QFC22_006308 [Naganishia vaughanmartiniae]
MLPNRQIRAARKPLPSKPQYASQHAQTTTHPAIGAVLASIRFNTTTRPSPSHTVTYSINDNLKRDGYTARFNNRSRRTGPFDSSNPANYQSTRRAYILLACRQDV